MFRGRRGPASRAGDACLYAFAAAQPVLAPHYFLAYVEKFERDRSRLADCRKRLNVLPLGAAALAGTSLPIDRDFVARELGFDAVPPTAWTLPATATFCSRPSSSWP